MKTASPLMAVRTRTAAWFAKAAGAAALVLGLAIPSSGQVVEYFHVDAIGNVRAITNQAGGIVEQHDYMPFGEELCGTAPCGTPPTGQAKRFTGKERDPETGQDYFGARYYGAAIGRFTTTDPLMEVMVNLVDVQRWNRYAYAMNGPLRFKDPDGRSTITAQDGTVLEVRNDGDLGVYRGTDRVGETERWDEFRAHDNSTGVILPHPINDARIDFGSSWDGAIASDNAHANFLGLMTTADKSGKGGYFDLKTSNIAPDGVGTGRLLNGKYATAQSAGNYLYGLNTATGTLLNGEKLTRDQAMRLAGAKQKDKGSAFGLARAFLGTAFGPAPYFGETPHAGRRIDEGFAAGRAKP